MILAPDELHREVYEGAVAEGVAKGNMLLFGHGFSDPLRRGQAAAGRRRRAHRPEGPRPPRAPPVPRGLRRARASSRSTRTRTATAQALALAYAKGIGCTRGGVIETTFKDETETDLFGEQAVLCGGASALVQAGFETLVEAGYDPQMAYFECLHELKLIVDLMYEKGLAGMRYSISNTAEYGDLTRGPQVVDDHVKASMKQILANIQSGDFAREWIAENRAGQENFQRLRSEAAAATIESTGKELRSHMSWIDGEFSDK